METEVKDSDVLLSVRHLRQYFNNGTFHAVEDVSFDIKKGEVFGLVGESGCGKTTTGRSLMKLYNITGGEVFFKGIRINSGSFEYSRKIQQAKLSFESQKANFYGDNKRSLINKARAEMNSIIREQKKQCRIASNEAKNCEKIWKKTNEGLSTLNSSEAKKSSLMTKIQMIFQDPSTSLDPRMTVREIIAEGLRIHGMKDENLITQKVSDVLKLMGLRPEYADRYPHEFSGGQKQRIGIARAIVMEPELIIADEIVSALDVSIKAQVINLLNDLRKSLGLTVMFIAHDLSVVKYFSDRIAVMYAGRIVELAPADELFKNPIHPYTKSLLSAIPLPNPDYEKKRKRIPYNPSNLQDYRFEEPRFVEIKPEHFILCNTNEENKYRSMFPDEKKESK